MIDFDHAYSKDIMVHLGDSTYYKYLMCPKTIAGNALRLLINHTAQDRPNGLKANYVKRTIIQDTELILYHARYHEMNDDLEDNVTPKNTMILRK